jgi:hypothetical protein
MIPQNLNLLEQVELSALRELKLSPENWLIYFNMFSNK